MTKLGFLIDYYVGVVGWAIFSRYWLPAFLFGSYTFFVFKAGAYFGN